MRNIKKSVKKILTAVRNIHSYFVIKQVKNQTLKRSGRIEVLFICQMPQLWGKLKPVYETMKADDTFCVTILAVPDHEDKSNVNKCYHYFAEKYTGVINAKTDQGWYDIDKNRYAYVFYQRPYDAYLPKCYRSSELAHFCKICYIAYGYLLTKTNEELCMDRAFFNHVYLYFAENEYVKKYNEERYPYSHKKGIRNSVFLGYPALINMQTSKQKVQRKENDRMHVIWTPRWTTNTGVGGSNFFKFKDDILSFFENNKMFSFVFRPHPMMFGNFLKTGEMSSEEIRHLKEIMKKSSNMELDKKAEYCETFWKSDVLITDVSSVIIEYLLTGNPIIYCKSGIVPNEFMKEILSVCYCVEDWKQIEDTLQNLRNGQDVLLEKRCALCERFKKENDLNTPDRMKEIIKQDYRKGVVYNENMYYRWWKCWNSNSCRSGPGREK